MKILPPLIICLFSVSFYYVSAQLSADNYRLEDADQDEADHSDDESGSGLVDDDNINDTHNGKANGDDSSDGQNGLGNMSKRDTIQTIQAEIREAQISRMHDRRVARQISEQTSSKLVKNTSSYLYGTQETASYTSRKSDVLSDNTKDKALSSSTNLVLPAVAVSKLSGITNSTSPSNATAVLNTTTTKNETSQKNAIPDDSNSESAGQGTGSKVEAIGPMEGIVVQVNGSTGTFNNFTNLQTEPAVETPSKLKVLNFVKTQESVKINVGKKKADISKKVQKSKSKSSKKHHAQKVFHSKKKISLKTKKSKDSKKEKVPHFPKIILYQGPISKALENILRARSSPFTPRIINAPMSFEEATSDIKRSSIARVEKKKKLGKLRNDDDEEEDSEDVDDDNDNEENSSKKSKVSKKQRKYSIKGNTESGKLDKKSITKKESKNEKGKKKFSVVIQAKKPSLTNRKLQKLGPIATINPSEGDDESKQVFPEFPKNQANEGKSSSTYKPSIVPDEAEPSSSQFTDFIKQMAMPISTPDNSLFPQDLQFNIKKTTKASKGNSKQYSIIGNSPKPSMEGQLSAENSNSKNSKETPSDGYEQEYPNPAGYGNKGKDNDNYDDDSDGNEIEEAMKEENNSTNSTNPNVVQVPLQSHPLSSASPGAPTPVVNAPDDDNKGSQTSEEKPTVSIGTNSQNPSVTPNQDDSNQGTYPFPMNIEANPDDGTDLTSSKPFEGGPMNPDLEGELTERVQDNSHDIKSLSNEVRDVESKLEEVGVAVENIEKDLNRIEKKLDQPRVAPPPMQQMQFPFSRFPGPLRSFAGIKSSGNIPIEVITGRKFPIKLPMGKGRWKHPRILKQFFVPLPPPGSQAANDIGKGSPVTGLPFPLNQIVSFLLKKMARRGNSQTFPINSQLQPQPMRVPQALPDIASPPREHDLDRLELELGKVPITRIASNNGLMRKKPRIIFISKSPNILDLAEKPCEEPCQNGGECIGNNVCKCPLRFSGPKCDRATHRSSTPGDILGLLGPLPLDADIEGPRKSNKISLPFVITESNNLDDEDRPSQKSMGQVEQSKIVDILTQFARNVPEFPDFRKRSYIPPRPQINRGYTGRYQGYSPYYQKR